MTRPDAQTTPQPSPRVVPQLAVFTAIVSLALGIVYVAAGQTLVEKTVTELVAPVGLVWLGLLALAWLLLSNGQRFFAAAAFCIWLILTLGGNAFVSHTLIGGLEAPWSDTDALAIEPLDVLVLLGGGTSNRSNGQAQLESDGQRVLTAATMFLTGQTQQIICTGSNSFQASELDLHPREEGRDLLRALNIPADRIHLIEGPNTSQEMKSLRRWLDENLTADRKPFERIGIVTSAYHLSRAVRLANANGITAIGIPANFKANSLALSPSWVVPNSDNLRKSAAAMKEFLAWVIGR